LTDLADDRNAIVRSAIKVKHTNKQMDRWTTDTRILIPRNAMQSAVLLQKIVRPSACDVEVSCSHRLEYLDNNFMAA